MDDAVLHELVQRLRESRKYRNVCDPTLARIGGWALARYPQPKLALKMAKNKLHQVYGAYMESLDASRVEAELDRAADSESIQSLCRGVLESHASTRERLDLLDTLYDDIFAVTGRPATVRDLACGLHPFALPWMGLPDRARYEPSDIDTRLCGLHNRLLRALGMPELAVCDDVLVDCERAPVELTFLLKSLPCLDQQELGLAAKLLPRLNSRWLVVSFPTRSLGGRSTRMNSHYAEYYTPLLATCGRIAATLAYSNERVYIVEAGSQEH